MCTRMVYGQNINGCTSLRDLTGRLLTDSILGHLYYWKLNFDGLISTKSFSISLLKNCAIQYVCVVCAGPSCLLNFRYFGFTLLQQIF